MSYDVKQVIVVRKDLNMRKGKIAAQASHASISFLSKMLRNKRQLSFKDLTAEEKEWFDGSFAKIVVSVNSEEELLEVYQKALDKGLTAHLIIDSGKTEFGGQPTKTCIAIGPHRSEKFNGVTEELSLL